MWNNITTKRQVRIGKKLTNDLVEIGTQFDDISKMLKIITLLLSFTKHNNKLHIIKTQHIIGYVKRKSLKQIHFIPFFHTKPSNQTNTLSISIGEIDALECRSLSGYILQMWNILMNQMKFDYDM